MSQYGHPVFHSTVFVTEDEDGNVNMPNLSGWDEDDIFQGEPPLDTVGVVCLPPPGYAEMKTRIEFGDSRYIDEVFLDATEMMTEVQGFPKIAEDALGGNVEWSPFRNILVQISQIASNKQKELESIDLNPIRITNKNGECQVLDASVVLRNSKNA